MSKNLSVKFCKTCLMPNTRPRIVFNKEGICNACITASKKASVDWKERKRNLLNFIDQYRGNHPYYDCVVPWSGGKDSSSIALKLKTELGLNPLLVTFSPLVPTHVGNHNRESLLRFGFDNIFVRPNQKVSSELSRRFFIERGNPKVHWDAGVNVAPMQVAVNYGIPLVFYAEHGESEYGGHVLDEKNLMIRDLAEVLEHQIGDDPMNWATSGIHEKDLAPYIYPEPKDLDRVGVKAVYFAYFFEWDVMNNFTYVKDKIDFKTAEGGRTCGTFSDYDSLDDKMDDLYYYMQFIKFGFGRCARDTSRLIYRGKMDRNEALRLSKLYEGEFPEHTIDAALEFMKISRPEFEKIVDKHRENWIWEKKDSRWDLRYPIE